ncbi:hypothetical protein P152DRAFT_513273 [Eremomyces bilateralis CBS 781.70]|uniref:Uncharacterized protein n=1 Tax=Eremomyces bilateralis CBS 781.70 TaxID=1392243 RepID=A0A6G1G7R6_9PEZI|nr:uncharacterized protein P152DRAFT_513273 [Eremomyces bilateralis CBS 781.70]KAF1813930.1 hypothetical protein P152DRAFT_513273 [Eremomyces bilateralis CBS 781.70]
MLLLLWWVILSLLMAGSVAGVAKTAIENLEGGNLDVSTSIASSASSSSSSAGNSIASTVRMPPIFLPAITPYPNISRFWSSGYFAISSATNSSTRLFPSNGTGQDVLATGTGWSYASSCNSAQQSWFNARIQFYMGIPSTTVTTDIHAATLRVAPVSTTNCGTATITYALDSPTHTLAITTRSWDSLIWTGPFRDWTESFLEPSPTCSIQPKDCSSLVSSWSIAMQVALSSNGVSTVNHPQCQIRTTECGKCTIGGGSVQLIYFPVPTTIARDMCAPNPIDDPAVITPAPDIPVATESFVDGTDGTAPVVDATRTGGSAGGQSGVVMNGTTFFVNSAYISFQYLLAGQYCDGSSSQIGGIYSSHLLAIPSASVSSMRFPNYGTAYRFNFADMNSPVPWSAYNGLTQCFIQQCQTLYYDDHKPVLAVPSAVRQLDPNWADCALDFDGLYDPPLALATATVLDGGRGGEGDGGNGNNEGGRGNDGNGGGSNLGGGTGDGGTAHPGQQPGDSLPQPTTAPQGGVSGGNAHNDGESVGGIIGGLLGGNTGSDSNSPGGNGASSGSPGGGSPADSSDPEPITLLPNGQTIVPNPSGPGIIVGGSTILPGGAPVTFLSGSGSGDSLIISAGISGDSGVVIISPSDNNESQQGGGGVAAPTTIIFHPGGTGSVPSRPGGEGQAAAADNIASLLSAAAAAGGMAFGFIFTAADGRVYTATQADFGVAGIAVISGQTLTMGGPGAVVDGNTISLGPGGLVVSGIGTVNAVGITGTTDIGEYVASGIRLSSIAGTGANSGRSNIFTEHSGTEQTDWKLVAISGYTQLAGGWFALMLQETKTVIVLT